MWRTESLQRLELEEVRVDAEPLRHCPNCGTVAQPDWKFCSRCNRPLVFNKKPLLTRWEIGGIALTITIVLGFGTYAVVDMVQAERRQNAEDAAKPWVPKPLTRDDTELYVAVKYAVKDTMKDPDSLKDLKIESCDQISGIHQNVYHVTVFYRGTNGFGGVVPDRAYFDAWRIEHSLQVKLARTER